MAKRPNRIKGRSVEKSGDIRPRDESPVSYMDEPPAFSLKYIQKAYCISECEKEDRLAFLEAMLKRKETSWNTLSSCDYQGLGYEKIKHGLNVQVPKVAAGKAIIAFRFSGKKPMVGFRERDIFYVLWLDRDFSVYDHG